MLNLKTCNKECPDFVFGKCQAGLTEHDCYEIQNLEHWKKKYKEFVEAQASK